MPAVSAGAAPADSLNTSMSSPCGRQPIAIVGMSCRFPGAPNVALFWSLLRDGIDAVREVPADRWDIATFYDPREGVAGKMVTRWGGFLDGVDQFDAEFFGISRREADRMDPQQRLVMETAWEALEHAGVAPHSLGGSDAGVFIGIGNADYMRMLCRDPQEIDRYDGTGGTLSFAANRLSYFLDLHGPSLGMESACSSSLVSLHLACRALRDGDTSLAIAGGVNLVLSPDMTVAFSQARMMSPTGRCRAFDAAADGYVRGEGCGIVILKRLDDALAAGDRILAVIRGSAINQDGTSNGITAPNGAAQQAVIRRACADAGVEPGRVGYVEAHGTGTRVGDPIEIQALTAVLGMGRPVGAPCWVGSVKTNIGHLEAAAGIAGLIKTVLVLQHRQIPPHLHLTELNPYLSLDGTAFRIPRALQPWPDDHGARIAGVSGFSFGGTNCHLILEEAPLPPAREAVTAAACLLPLSARSLPALRELAECYRDHLRTDASQSLVDLCRTAGEGRDHFRYRLAVTGATADEMAGRLAAWCEARSDWGGAQGTAARHASPEAVFLFTGQGAGHAGAGRCLYRDHAGFRRAIDRCDEILRTVGSTCSVGQLLSVDAPLAAPRTPELIQPMIFALGYALAEVWHGWGVQPQAVIGHSLGEYVAACVAGVFSLEDALALVAERGRLTGALAEPGVMAIVFAPEAAVATVLGRGSARVSVAAVNGPRATVVSGDAAAVDSLLRAFVDQGIDGQLLETTHAFHSPLMMPMVAAFRAAAERIAYRAPTIPLVAGLTGAIWPDGDGPGSDYWCRHLLETVRFADGLRSLANGRPRTIVELGAGASLTRQAARCGLGDDLRFVASLPPAKEENDALLAALGTLYTHGHNVEWRRLYTGNGSRAVVLPSYPFQRQRYWYRNAQVGSSETGTGIAAQSVAIDATPAVSAGIVCGPPLARVVQVAQPVSDFPRRLEHILSIIRAEFAELLHGDAHALDEDASFIELGADSLVLVDAVHRVGQRFGVPISVRQLFDEIPTPRTLAEYVAAQASTARLPPVSSDTAAAGGAAPPLSAPSGGASPMPGGLAELTRQQRRPLEQPLVLSEARPRVGQPAISPTKYAPTCGSGPTHSTHREVSSSAGTSLSTEQRRYLDRLIERYVERTGGSRARAAGTRPMLADSRASAGFRRSTKEMLYPIVGSHGEGARFWDIDGNEYIDIAMGFGVSFFGHRPPFLCDALAEQWRRGLQIGPQSPLAGDVASVIRELTGVERAAFCNSGTEAVMTAVRLARAVTGRSRIALFAGSYHGHTDGVLAAASARPSSAGVTPGAVADVLVLDYGAPESLDILDRFGDELAAILVEPVQSRRPDLQPRDFLHRLREIATSRGAALIFDEVLTGFRIHPGGAQAWFDVRADIVTYGKMVGGGLPIGIVAGVSHFLNAIDGGPWSYGDASSPRAETIFFAGTFNKNHLTMATAHAVLTHLKAAGPALQETLNARTARLAEALDREFARRGAAVRVARFGSMFRFQVSENLDPFFYGLIEKGLYVWEGRTCFLSSAHTDADIEQIVGRVSAVLDEMAAAGWFARGGTRHVPAAGRRLALNPAQRAIWVASQLGPAACAAYNESVTIELRGPLDRDVLAHAVTLLIERHDALRLTVAPDGTYQTVGLPPQGLIPIVPGPGDRRTQAREWLARTLLEPFDLAVGPPVSFRLLEIDDAEHWVVMIVHHVITDGLSLVTLARELGTYYAALAKEARPNLPQAPSFADYVQRTDPATQPDRWAAGRAYWRAHLAAPVPKVELPLDRPRLPVRAYAGARARADMAADLRDRLATMASSHGCTLFMAMLAGFRVLLYRLVGTDEVLIGLSTAGQSADGASGLVGCCVNVLPLRCGGGADLTVAELLRNIRRSVLEAYEHQWLALSDLVPDLDLPREPGRPPLMDVHFNYDKVETGVDYGPLTARLTTNGAGAARRDLTWNPVEADGRLSLIVDYDADLFDAATVHGWLAEYEWVLDRMAARADLSIAALAAEIAAMRTGSLTRLAGDRLRTARRRVLGPA